MFFFSTNQNLYHKNITPFFCLLLPIPRVNIRISTIRISHSTSPTEYRHASQPRKSLEHPTTDHWRRRFGRPCEGLGRVGGRRPRGFSCLRRPPCLGLSKGGLKSARIIHGRLRDNRWQEKCNMHKGTLSMWICDVLDDIYIREGREKTHYVKEVLSVWRCAFLSLSKGR